ETRHAGMIALASFLFVGPAEEKKVVSHIRQTDPHLLAVQYPLVSFATRSRACPDDIRTGAGFGQTIGRDLLAACLRRQVLLLLFLGAPRVKRQRIQSGMDRHHYTQKGIDCFEFLAHESERDVVETGAAIFL